MLDYYAQNRKRKCLSFAQISLKRKETERLSVLQIIKTLYSSPVVKYTKAEPCP